MGAVKRYRHKKIVISVIAFLGGRILVVPAATEQESICVLCIFFPFILDIKFVGRTSQGHTGFLIHLPSAVQALIFLARRIQPFLSLVERVSRILCTNDLIVLHLLGFFFLVRKISFTGIRTHVPTCQKVTRLLLSYRGDLLSQIGQRQPK